ncbi:MAG: hypothetical protein ACXADA_22550 [Candidatus Hodarchaeales archaeon]|jgi:hypothetical protein
MVVVKFSFESKELPPDNYLHALQKLIALKKLHLPDEDLDERLSYLDDQLLDEILPAITRAANSRIFAPQTVVMTVKGSTV